MSSTVTVVS